MGGPNTFFASNTARTFIPHWSPLVNKLQMHTHEFVRSDKFDDVDSIYFIKGEDHKGLSDQLTRVLTGSAA